MERHPTKSTLKCIETINQGCEKKPVGLLVGRHQRGYEIQVMVCKNHLTEGQEFARKKYLGIYFDIWERPRWLQGAQATEEENTRNITS